MQFYKQLIGVKPAISIFIALLTQKILSRILLYLDNTISSLYEASKPDVLDQKQRPLIAIIQYLRGIVDTHINQADIDDVNEKIAELLDESMVVDNSEKFAVMEHQAEYKIVQKNRVWDLSKLNVEKLKEEFAETQYKHIEIAELKTFIEDKLRRMLEANYTRVDFAQKNYN